MAKVILYKSKTLSDDTHPIVIRWYENGRQRIFTVGSCTKEQWNANKGQVKRSHPFANQLNENIKEKLGQAILDGGIKKKAESLLLVDLIDARKLKGEKLGSLSIYNKHSQLKSDLLEWKSKIKYSTLDDFTEKDAESFYHFLIKTKENNKNTSARKMSTLASIFREARKNKITKNDPLENLSFPKEVAIKGKLTRDELTKIEQMDLNGRSIGWQLARDIFILQFYTRGIRIGDALSLKPSNVESDRIVFRENKTGSLRSIPIHPKVRMIIDRYQNESIYLLPILKHRHNKGKTEAENMLIYKKSIESATTGINRYLKKIGILLNIQTKITTHIARHSFAKIAIDTVKNIRISQELLGHSSLRVHQDYLRDLEDNEELDQSAKDIYG